MFGPVGRCCGSYYGPKYLVCIMVTSVWGFFFLLMLGIFFQIKSAILIEDITVPELLPNTTTSQWVSEIDAIYNQQAINCFVASVLYVVTFGAAALRFRILMKKTE